jgi:hypothetical protein
MGFAGEFASRLVRDGSRVHNRIKPARSAECFQSRRGRRPFRTGRRDLVGCFHRFLFSTRGNGEFSGLSVSASRRSAEPASGMEEGAFTAPL